jgi:2-octaprenyl-6-methoxyphenol hydroxylase
MDNPGAAAETAGMVHDADVAIVGGGLNGPVLALALAQAGLPVALVDAQAPRAREAAGFDGRAYAISAGSRRLLQAVGVWAGVAAGAQPILRIRTRDGGARAEASPLDFEGGEIEDGPMGHIVEDRHLHAAMMAAVANEPRIALTQGATVVAQEIGPARVVLRLADGGMVTARVLVGADGRASGTAARAGIGRIAQGYGQTALVAAVAHAQPHGGTAEQVFLPGGPLAILPLAGDRSAIVWSEREPRATAIAALPDGAFLAVLGEAMGGHLGRLTLAGGRFTYPLTLSLAERYVAPRVALAGDAAHGVHPIAGQGLNIGLRDVAALAEVLVTAARRGEDIGAPDVLDRYQVWRRFDATALALGIDRVNALFSNDNPLLRAARVAGMGLVGQIPGLRRGFIRQAAGLTGDLPRLMRGEAI